MIGRLAGVVLGIGVAASAEAGVCDAPDASTLLWSDCDGASTARLVLLPEDASVTPSDAIDVTGAYTATDKREGGRPKPVGLFVRSGDVVSREYVRFDGLLVIDAAGEATLGYRRRARFGGDIFDLEDKEARKAFIDAVAARGGSLLQSHLLIVEGAVDTAPVAGAPRFRRRILMQDEDGSLGLYDSTPRALTLNEAANEVARLFSPAMALNLDMGSYDFCRQGETLCGALRYDETGKLSNLLRFSAPAE